MATTTTTTVTWVLDADSRYEISSKDHLIQLMNNGGLYTNAGSVPSDFMRSSYIQTADIDLEHDPNIYPIGRESSPFSNNSKYDGGTFSISNWSYTDPNYETDATTCESYVGLFGYIYGSVVQNVHLTGLCTLRGFSSSTGMVIGKSEFSNVYNVTCSFSSGSEIVQGTANSSVMKLGGVIGEMRYGVLYGVRLEGELSIRHQNTATQSYLGGILGNCAYTPITLFQNLATFTTNLTAFEVGGCIGRMFRGSVVNLMNAMKGGIGQGNKIGGVIGFYRNDTTGLTCNGLVCSMQGNIDAGSSGHAGGIIGALQPGTSSQALHSLLNYMGGDVNISGGTTATTRCGGLIGWSTSSNPNVQTSIVAMNGFTQNTIIGNVASVSGILGTINTEFGLTFAKDNYSTTDAVVGLLTDPNYFNLPYVDLSGTDSNGTVYSWEFIFGNETTLDLAARALNIVASFKAVNGVVGYKVTVENTQKEGSNVVEVSIGTTDVEYNIKSLEPETEYLVRVYSTLDGSTYDLHLEATETTKANVASNYDMNDFAKPQGGGYDVSELDSESSKRFYEVVNDILSTGETIKISVPGGESRSAKFVKRGETVPIEGEDTLLIPFSADAGSAQEVAITLSDSSSVTLAYDETNETVNINGSGYAIGESLVLDGKKLTIQDV